MTDRSQRLKLAAAGLLLWVPTALAASWPQGASLSGYAKSLNFVSEDRASKRWKGLTGDRLRLDAEWQDSEQVADLKLVSDHEVLYGPLIASQKTALAANLGKNELLDLNWTLNEKENLWWRHVLYRAYARVRVRGLDVMAGRQRIAWGQGRLWNPSDVVNPYNPLSVERQERAGSDALDLRWSFTGLSFLEGVYVPRRKGQWDNSLALGRARINFKEMDWGLLGGKREEENLIGADHAAQLWEGSLRSEAVYFLDSKARRDFLRAVLSYDTHLHFPKPLYVLGEFHYNGVGERDRAEYPKVVLKPTDQQFLAKDYFGFGLSYEFTSLWKGECFGIVNLDDGSAFAGPQITWQPVADLEVAAGVQTFQGKSLSEFGRLEDVAFIQIQWFFSKK